MIKLMCSSLHRSFEMMVTPECSPAACLSSHSSLLGWPESQGVGTTVIPFTTIAETQFAHLQMASKTIKTSRSLLIISNKSVWFWSTGLVVECLFVLRIMKLVWQAWDQPRVSAMLVKQEDSMCVDWLLGIWWRTEQIFTQYYRTHSPTALSVPF